MTAIGQITGQNPPFILGTTFELWPLGYTEAERAVAAGFLLAADAGEITAIAAVNSPAW
jgi:hypothetical protein